MYQPATLPYCFTVGRACFGGGMSNNFGTGGCNGRSVEVKVAK